jgi:hypothetical protein
MEQFGTVDDAKLADTFAFGPDVVEQLKTKVSIMRDHWLDVEHYLAPPLK